MHELSLCDNLLDQVFHIASQHQEHRVESITLDIGPLAGVEPLLLNTAFEILKKDTLVEYTQLIIRPTTIKVLCQSCGLESDAKVNDLSCQHCHCLETTLLSGDELILASVALISISSTPSRSNYV